MSSLQTESRLVLAVEGEEVERMVAVHGRPAKGIGRGQEDGGKGGRGKGASGSRCAGGREIHFPLFISSVSLVGV